MLYTDCDVMFMDEATEDLKRLGCRFFAVTLEFDPKDWQRMNTSVMLMNPKNLIAVPRSNTGSKRLSEIRGSSTSTALGNRFR